MRCSTYEIQAQNNNDNDETSTTISSGNGIATPQTTNPNMISNCNKFH
jgi:hypothetical protein